MIGLIQRVSHASVTVDTETVGAIGPGMLVLVGVQKDDDENKATRLCERLLGYRIFADDSGRMNLALRDTGGGLLLVPQFTLAADTRKGMRPGFSSAAPPAAASVLFDQLVARCCAAHADVACGLFGANMQVQLVNDGPVTFHLQV